MMDTLLPQVCAARVGLRRYGVQFEAIGRYNIATGVPSPLFDQPVHLSRHRFLTRLGAQRFARVFRITGPAYDGTMYAARAVELVQAR